MSQPLGWLGLAHPASSSPFSWSSPLDNAVPLPPYIPLTFYDPIRSDWSSRWSLRRFIVRIVRSESKRNYDLASGPRRNMNGVLMYLALALDAIERYFDTLCTLMISISILLFIPPPLFFLFFFPFTCHTSIELQHTFVYSLFFFLLFFLYVTMYCHLCLLFVEFCSFLVFSSTHYSCIHKVWQLPVAILMDRSRSRDTLRTWHLVTSLVCSCRCRNLENRSKRIAWLSTSQARTQSPLTQFSWC